MKRQVAAGVLLSALALACLPACGTAQQKQVERPAERSGLALKRIGSFDSPTYATGAAGFPKLLFVVEQPGRIEVLRAGHELRHPFLDISDLVDFGGERGLLSVAFPPDYEQSGDFY